MANLWRIQKINKFIKDYASDELKTNQEVDLIC